MNTPTNPQMDPEAQAALMRKCEELVRHARPPGPPLWLLIIVTHILTFICGVLVAYTLTHAQ